jgi:plastocyanin
VNGNCVLSCSDGFADCDAIASTGCEVHIAEDPGNCGACKAACATTNIASNSCTNGVCTGTCEMGWADCRGTKRSTGCQTNILNDPANCGGCGSICPAGAACANGSCIATMPGPDGGSPWTPDMGVVPPPQDMGFFVPPDQGINVVPGDGGTISGGTIHTVQVGPNGAFAFSPSQLTIAVGDTVQWVWMASGHTVTSGIPSSVSCIPDGAFCSPSDTNCAVGATSVAGSTYSHKFTTVGTFQYFCMPHCLAGMTGAIKVQ